MTPEQTAKEVLKGLLETAKEYREERKIALGEVRDRKINAMYYKEIEEAEKILKGMNK